MVASVPEFTSRTISMEGIICADRFGEFDLLFGGRAEAGAARDGVVQGVEDDGMPMAQNERSPGTDVVDVFVAVGIEDVGAFAAFDEGRRAADAALGAHRGVNAAGNGELRAFEELLRACVIHLFIAPTVSLADRHIQQRHPILHRLQPEAAED